MIIAFAGHVASGKSTYSRELAGLLGWPRFSFGEFVAECAGEIGLDPHDRSTLQDLGHRMALRPEPFCRAFLNWIEARDDFVLDGLRHLTVLRELKRQTASVAVKVVFVDTPLSKAQERHERRGRDTVGLDRVRGHKVESSIDCLRQEADWFLDGQDATGAERLATQIRGSEQQ